MFFGNKRYFHGQNIQLIERPDPPTRKKGDSDKKKKKKKGKDDKKVSLGKLKKQFGDDIIMMILLKLLGDTGRSKKEEKKEKKPRGMRRAGGGGRGGGGGFQTAKQLAAQRAGETKLARLSMLGKQGENEDDAAYLKRLLKEIYTAETPQISPFVDGILAAGQGDTMPQTAPAFKDTIGQLIQYQQILRTGTFEGQKLTKKKRAAVEKSVLRALGQVSGEVREKFLEQSKDRFIGRGKEKALAVLRTIYGPDFKLPDGTDYRVVIDEGDGSIYSEDAFTRRRKKRGTPQPKSDSDTTPTGSLSTGAREKAKRAAETINQANSDLSSQDAPSLDRPRSVQFSDEGFIEVRPKVYSRLTDEAREQYLREYIAKLPRGLRDDDEKLQKYKRRYTFEYIDESGELVEDFIEDVDIDVLAAYKASGKQSNRGRSPTDPLRIPTYEELRARTAEGGSDISVESGLVTPQIIEERIREEILRRGGRGTGEVSAESSIVSAGGTRYTFRNQGSAGAAVGEFRRSQEEELERKAAEERGERFTPVPIVDVSESSSTGTVSVTTGSGSSQPVETEAARKVRLQTEDIQGRETARTAQTEEDRQAALSLAAQTSISTPSSISTTNRELKKKQITGISVPDQNRYNRIRRLQDDMLRANNITPENDAIDILGDIATNIIDKVSGGGFTEEDILKQTQDFIAANITDTDFFTSNIRDVDESVAVSETVDRAKAKKKYKPKSLKHFDEIDAKILSMEGKATADEIAILRGIKSAGIDKGTSAADIDRTIDRRIANIQAGITLPELKEKRVGTFKTRVGEGEIVKPVIEEDGSKSATKFRYNNPDTGQEEQVDILDDLPVVGRMYAELAGASKSEKKKIKEQIKQVTSDYTYQIRKEALGEDVEEKDGYAEESVSSENADFLKSVETDKKLVKKGYDVPDEFKSTGYAALDDDEEVVGRGEKGFKVVNSSTGFVRYIDRKALTGNDKTFFETQQRLRETGSTTSSSSGSSPPPETGAGRVLAKRIEDVPEGRFNPDVVSKKVVTELDLAGPAKPQGFTGSDIDSSVSEGEARDRERILKEIFGFIDPPTVEEQLEAGSNPASLDAASIDESVDLDEARRLYEEQERNQKKTAKEIAALRKLDRFIKSKEAGRGKVETESESSVSGGGSGVFPTPRGRLEIADRPATDVEAIDEDPILERDIQAEAIVSATSTKTPSDLESFRLPTSTPSPLDIPEERLRRGGGRGAYQYSSESSEPDSRELITRETQEKKADRLEQLEDELEATLERGKRKNLTAEAFARLEALPNFDEMTETRRKKTMTQFRKDIKAEIEQRASEIQAEQFRISVPPAAVDPVAERERAAFIQEEGLVEQVGQLPRLEKDFPEAQEEEESEIAEAESDLPPEKQTKAKLLDKHTGQEQKELAEIQKRLEELVRDGGDFEAEFRQLRDRKVLLTETKAIKEEEIALKLQLAQVEGVDQREVKSELGDKPRLFRKEPRKPVESVNDPDPVPETTRRRRNVKGKQTKAQRDRQLVEDFLSNPQLLTPQDKQKAQDLLLEREAKARLKTEELTEEELAKLDPTVRGREITPEEKQRRQVDKMGRFLESLPADADTYESAFDALDVFTGAKELPETEKQTKERETRERLRGISDAESRRLQKLRIKLKRSGQYTDEQIESMIIEGFAGEQPEIVGQLASGEQVAQPQQQLPVLLQRESDEGTSSFEERERATFRAKAIEEGLKQGKVPKKVGKDLPAPRKIKETIRKFDAKIKSIGDKVKPSDGSEADDRRYQRDLAEAQVTIELLQKQRARAVEQQQQLAFAVLRDKEKDSSSYDNLFSESTPSGETDEAREARLARNLEVKQKRSKRAERLGEIDIAAEAQRLYQDVIDKFERDLAAGKKKESQRARAEIKAAQLAENYIDDQEQFFGFRKGITGQALPTKPLKLPVNPTKQLGNFADGAEPEWVKRNRELEQTEEGRDQLALERGLRKIGLTATKKGGGARNLAEIAEEVDAAAAAPKLPTKSKLPTFKYRQKEYPILVDDDGKQYIEYSGQKTNTIGGKKYKTDFTRAIYIDDPQRKKILERELQQVDEQVDQAAVERDVESVSDSRSSEEKLQALVDTGGGFDVDEGFEEAGEAEAGQEERQEESESDESIQLGPSERIV